MNKLKYLLLTIIILSALLLGACNLPIAGSDEEVAATTVAETAAAVFTHAAETAAVTGVPSATTAPEETAIASTNTPMPTLPPAVTATNTPIPCNRGGFVKDVSIPDGENIAAGAAFTKTWRIKNNGSCTWGTNYIVLFDSGEQMGAPASIPLGGSVAPGATIDISVNLTAPANPGTYQGNFKLKSHDNIVFGINSDAQGPFWVKIVVPNPAPTPTATATSAPTPPDLTISNFTMPDPPTQGLFVNVSITVYNQGQTDTGAFVLEWWGGTNFTTPSCTWNIPSLSGEGTVTKTCNSFKYSSWYGSITTKAEVDTTGAISESDESNNIITRNISVAKP